MSIGEGTRDERDVRTLPTHGVSVPSQLSGHFWTGSVLNSLPPEWTVLHARHWPGRSFDVIDHLAIGPNGIFVIDSVGWSGKVDRKSTRLNSSHLTQSRMPSSA